MDPLARALRRERLDQGSSRTEHKEDVSEHPVKTGLVSEHLETMVKTGLAFEHKFEGEKLGFKIVLAKYGKGRTFVRVDAVLDHCEVKGKLKDDDELIAINGRVIDATADTFDQLKKDIVAAPRPLALTFIEGENHAQEHDLEDKLFRLVSESEACCKRAQEALDAAAKPDAADAAARDATSNADKAKALAAQAKLLDSSASCLTVLDANAKKADDCAAAARRVADEPRLAPPPSSSEPATSASAPKKSSAIGASFLAAAVFAALLAAASFYFSKIAA